MAEVHINPISINYIPTIKGAVATVGDNDKVTPVKLSREDLVDLRGQIDACIDAIDGKIKIQSLDVAKGIPPQKKAEKDKYVTIPSTLYQGFKNLQVENNKLQRDKMILKEELKKMQAK